MSGRRLACDRGYRVRPCLVAAAQPPHPIDDSLTALRPLRAGSRLDTPRTCGRSLLNLGEVCAGVTTRLRASHLAQDRTLGAGGTVVDKYPRVANGFQSLAIPESLRPTPPRSLPAGP